MRFAPYLCFIVGSSFLTTFVGAERKLPNIVMIMADDLGWNGLACYGTDLIETPHLDQLAAESNERKAA